MTQKQYAIRNTQYAIFITWDKTKFSLLVGLMDVLLFENVFHSGSNKTMKGLKYISPIVEKGEESVLTYS